MKTLYIGKVSGTNVLVDIDKNEVDSINSRREAISRVYLIEEDLHVVYGKGDSKQELDVHPDDILIVFYDDTFKHRVIVAHSDDWVENLKEYEKVEQKRKEEWAARNNEDCCKCGSTIN